MNDFDNFDKWSLIIFVIVILGILIASMFIYGNALNYFVEAVKELQ